MQVQQQVEKLALLAESVQQAFAAYCRALSAIDNVTAPTDASLGIAVYAMREGQPPVVVSIPDGAAERDTVLSFIAEQLVTEMESRIEYLRDAAVTLLATIAAARGLGDPAAEPPAGVTAAATLSTGAAQPPLIDSPLPTDATPPVLPSPPLPVPEPTGERPQRVRTVPIT